MKKSELKSRLVNGIDNLVDEWFDDNKLFNGIAHTIVKANQNKFDGIIDMLTNENGDVLVDELLQYMTEDIQIDLTKYSSLLPNKILILSKQDVMNIIKGTHIA